MVKIVFPTGKGGLDDIVYDRLGRAPTFTIVEVDESTGEIKNVKVTSNPGYYAGSGAGVKAAQVLGDHGVNVYSGPNPGPNAYAAIQYLGIKVIPGFIGLKIKDAVKKVLEQLHP
ncbi:MAG: NifB/NifX family molybdenum-iron cluster-binding protein [Desulfurococcales archaeon]|nr:NifB/NifX family molybdenum-iron cluster-binding protein [Desulfurococcales archaeon]